jgi:hypothetical protein
VSPHQKKEEFFGERIRCAARVKNLSKKKEEEDESFATSGDNRGSFSEWGDRKRRQGT